MKVSRVVALVSALFLASASAFTEETANVPVLDDAMIEAINSGNYGWRAARHAKFEGMTLGDATRMLRAGWTMRPAEKYPTVHLNGESLPDTFDSREEWKDCIHPIRDQKQCGSCWAFAASEVLSDRFCIASKGKVNEVLSPQAMVSCDKRDYGCNGGYLDRSWLYLENTGIPTDACYPYKSGSGVTGICKTDNKCADDSKWKLYKAKSGSSRRLADEQSIMTDLTQNGPVEAGFMVYQDFFSYSSGVYSHQFGGLAGGHAIKIVGWGMDKESKKAYWIVANSWGEDWGIKGFFWILKGTNECGIEDQVYAGLPDLDSVSTD